jgi:CheY-like chemotaxis protein
MAKLLLLDDDEQATTWMAAALDSRGHEVSAYSSARAALDSLERSAPDLIVADILMPEIDGVAFARLVHLHRNVPIMFVSIAKRQAEAVLAGAVGYVSKPASARDIRDAVERILGEGARKNVILVVDDDADVLALYRDFLESRFEVRGALNGLEGLREMQTHRVDLAIVDVHMPVMNGVDLVRAMRADSTLQALPVIVQTTDPTALRAPVWKALQVAKVLDKMRFVDWCEEQMGGGNEGR